MARSFLVPINLNQLELQNARIQNLSTTQIGSIASPVTGQVVYDSTVNQLKVYEGTGWAPVGGVATGTGAPSSTPMSIGSMYLDLTNLVVYVSNGTASSANWVPVMPYGLTADMANLGLANAQGSSLKVSRADHVHRHIDADHSGIHLNALATATADYSMGTYKITNLATPVAGTDAANKNYVDAAVTGLNVHDEVQVATTANLTGWTYAAGTTDASQGTGIGATLTNGTTGTSTIDGYTLLANDRVLVKNQTTQTQNGIYTVTTAGTTGVATVLTRATDSDNHIAGQITAGDFVFVTGGSTQISTGWTQTASGTATTPVKGIKLGTDAITFSQFSGAGTYTASNGVTLSGNNFVFTPTTTGGLQTGSSGAAVLLPSTSGLKTDANGLALNPTSTGGLTTSASGSLILLPSTSGLKTDASGLALNPTSTGGLTTSASGAYILLATNSGLATSSSGLTVTAGLGITLSGGGAAGAATANTVAINTDVVARKYTTTIGDGTTTSYTVTHNLNSRYVQVTVFDASSYAQVFTDVANTTVNTVTISFANAPGVNAYNVIVVG
jgi:hypothetical protein